jgi:hypothetical protein
MMETELVRLLEGLANSLGLSVDQVVHRGETSFATEREKEQRLIHKNASDIMQTSL